MIYNDTRPDAEATFTEKIGEARGTWTTGYAHWAGAGIMEGALNVGFSRRDDAGIVDVGWRKFDAWRLAPKS